MGPTMLEELLDWVTRHHFGKYRGVVTQNVDPAKRGRLKVKVPAVLGAAEVWAMPCVPYAGNQVGTYLMPDEGAGVWVEFEAGDPSFPIWTGCFWGDDQTPGDADPKVKLIKTAIAELKVDDGEPKEVVFERTDGVKATATDTLTVEAGDASLELLGSDAVLAQGSTSLTVGGGSVKAE